MIPSVPTTAAVVAAVSVSLAPGMAGTWPPSIIDQSSSTLSSQIAAVAGVVALLAHAGGLWRLRSRAEGGSASNLPAALMFLGGIIGLWMATSGPLHALGRWSLAAHMGQHMLLFAYVPPLLVVARPVRTFVRAFVAAGAGAHLRPPGREGGAGAALLPATAVHSLVMWFWHHPAAITSTLFDDRLQLAMHASFVLSGMWFWSALVERGRGSRAELGTPLIALVSIMMQMGLLGALLTFSPRVLYPVCADRAPLLGLEPFADQQLAGLIMWVPACVPYVLGALWLMQRWFRQGSAAARQ